MSAALIAQRPHCLTYSLVSYFRAPNSFPEAGLGQGLEKAGAEYDRMDKAAIPARTKGNLFGESRRIVVTRVARCRRWRWCSAGTVQGRGTRLVGRRAGRAVAKVNPRSVEGHPGEVVDPQRGLPGSGWRPPPSVVARETGVPACRFGFMAFLLLRRGEAHTVSAHILTHRATRRNPHRHPVSLVRLHQSRRPFRAFGVGRHRTMGVCEARRLPPCSRHRPSSHGYDSREKRSGTVARHPLPTEDRCPQDARPWMRSMARRHEMQIEKSPSLAERPRRARPPRR